MKKHYLLYCILLLITPLSSRADNYVIINQVMYDTPFNEQVAYPPFSNGEYIELYNGSNSSVSLQGWYVTGDGTTEKFYFPDISVSSHGCLIIAYRHSGSPSFTLEDVFAGAGNTTTPVIYQNILTLSNSGENVTLFNANHETVDRIYYDGNSHLTKPDRLSADNPDGTPGDSCISLHRTWVEFDENGLVVPGTSQWKTSSVSFGSCQLAETEFGEHNIIGAQPLPDGENYILTVSPLDPTTRVSVTDNGVSVSNGVRTRTDIQYYDGLGRPNEHIAIEAAPDRLDLVEMTHYTGLQRAAQQWLSVPVRTEGQYLETSSLSNQTQTYYADNRPFTETIYENSALNRVTGQKRPGESYSSAPSINSYAINNESNDVRIYTVLNNGKLKTTGSCYAPSTLYKTTVSDEDDKHVTTYTDILGRKIMEDRAGCRTYYVYDELGRLRFVLPPISANKLNNGEYALSNPIMQVAVYCYLYDSVGNVIYKRLPGCGAQYLVYDVMGQLVLKQDSNQRVDNKWTLFAYDSIGRNLYTAEITLPNNHDYYVHLFADKWQVEHYGNNPSHVSITGTGYASTILGKSGLRPLTLNYYDDYDYLGRLSTSIRQKLRFSQESGYGLQYDNATGLLTGTRTYSLSETGCSTTTAYYYDAEGRVVQSRSVRSSDEYKTITSTEYLFDGSIARQLTEQGREDDLVREHYRYTYDHAGRTKKVYYKLNNDAEITLSAFSYDSIGRLVQNLLHNNKDTIRFSYDMRNMLKETINRHFYEKLFYADSAFAHVVPCYNGNISYSRLVSAVDTLSFYNRYDEQNRLERSCLSPKYNDRTIGEVFSYDDAGNIVSLKRHNGIRFIDVLTYYYGNNGGNQPISITDNVQPSSLYGTIEYHNGSSHNDTTMLYDGNGNLISDADRGISVISYNILNLPDTIQFLNGNQIVNLYDAAGRKYQSKVFTNLATTITPYYHIANYSYTNDSIEYRITDYKGNIETYFTSRDTTRRIFNTIGYYTDSTYYHYIKDHLGNICAIVNSENDSAVQSTLYYASGVPIANSFGRDKQPYLYNGKEFIEAHGLNEYDSQARMYYATIMRTTTMDPLAEEYYHISPYAWCGNNPIAFIDPDGNKVWMFDKNGNLEHSEDDNTQDALVMNGKQITFEYGSIKDVVLEKSGQTTFTFGDANVAAEAFKFLSENSEVEYLALLATEDDSKIYTQHILDEVACNFSQHMESAPSTYLMMHNHPGNTRPSGFSEGSKIPNDRLTAQVLMDKGILLASCVYCPKYGMLIPYDAIRIYSYRNWESVFSPSGKMLTYLRPETKYLTTDPVYPTIHIR